MTLLGISLVLCLVGAALLLLSLGVRRLSTYQGDNVLGLGTLVLFWGVLLGVIGLIRWVF